MSCAYKDLGHMLDILHFVPYLEHWQLTTMCHLLRTMMKISMLRLWI